MTGEKHEQGEEIKKLTKMLNANYEANLELEKEVHLLNAYLVENGLAEEYCKWKRIDKEVK